jgi:hypothetical protein
MRDNGDGYIMAHLRKILTAVFLVLALQSPANAGPFGDCKQQVVNKFGAGVLTLDYWQMIEAIQDQAACGKLLDPNNPKHKEIIEWHREIEKTRRSPLTRNIGF